MTGDPRAFFTVDRGAATTAVALIGRVDGAWRLVGAVSLPAASDPDAARALLLRRLIAADEVLARRLGIDAAAPDVVPSVEVRSGSARRLAVVAATERSLAPLLASARRSGWRTVGASAETTDPLTMSQMLLGAGVDGILAGAGDPPGADERSSLGELTALVTAVASRRPERLIVLAGAMAEAAASLGDLQARPGETLLAPAARSGDDGAPLRDLLIELALPPGDARRALGSSAATLANVLDRRVELIEIGYDGGVRVLATPPTPSEGPRLDLAIVPTAGLAPADPDDAVVDQVLAWLAMASDRHRLRDRLRELRIAPWSDTTGEGIALRMAAARAALGRLADAAPDHAGAPAPDLIVAAGGVWATVSSADTALAIADVRRRHGASAYALDHARLLGPLGAIPDDDERRAVLSDLADDVLAPLGTIVTPAGLRAGRTAGHLVLHPHGNGSQAAAIDLHSGGLQVVALPPGSTATAEFRFRDGVRLGSRGRHFAVDVTGGLAGLLLDLRDVPLRLPERADRRRELLDTWQVAAHGTVDG